MLFQNILCIFLGHKTGKYILAYRIKRYDTFYEVKIYSVKCKACGAKMIEDIPSNAKATEEWNRRNNHGSNKE